MKKDFFPPQIYMLTAYNIFEEAYEKVSSS